MPNDQSRTTGPTRVQRKRMKGWRMPEGAVYIGRPTVWQNPYGLPGKGAMIECASREEAIMLHREMVAGECSAVRRVPGYIQQLRGKTLACWCRPDQACHGDLLLRLANGPPMCFPEEPPDRTIQDKRQEAMAL